MPELSRPSKGVRESDLPDEWKALIQKAIDMGKWVDVSKIKRI